MRIITGFFRGKQIILPSYFECRPTTDMAKESLFNIINNEFEISQIRFLDLFSGTGSISYEMASRGCKDITCVEKEKRYCSFIDKSFKTMFPEKSPAKVFCFDAFKFIETGSLNYDLIFADPPYEAEGIEKIPEIILNNNSFKEGSVLIMEHSAKTRFTDLTHIKDQRRYGKVNFSFFEK